MSNFREKEAAKSNQQPIVLEEDTHRTKYQPTLKLMRRENDEDDTTNQQQPDAAEINKV